MFFFNDINDLSFCSNKTIEIFEAIKNVEDYRVEMDKNTTCIFCLKVDDNEYYETQSTNSISYLSKQICLIEEDLNYFKKHVFLYTSDMLQFANENIGNISKMFNEYLTEEYFNEYKRSQKENYKYDFIINVFIKFSFLSFKEYQVKAQEKSFISVSEFIQNECLIKKIDHTYVESVMKNIEGLQKLENPENVIDGLYAWLDELLEDEENTEDLDEVMIDEN